jgi:hypothetical protein
MLSEKLKSINSKDLLLPAGIMLLVCGGTILLDQTLQTGWLSQTVVIAAGLLLAAGGLLARSMLWTLCGGLFAAVGAGSFFLLLAVEQPWSTRLGVFLVCFGLGWLLVLMACVLFLEQKPWWALLPGGLSAALGICFLFSPLRLVDFILYAGLGIGIPLLAWGSLKPLMGLIIPGCLLLGAGVGIYLAWAEVLESTDLAQTGIMLVFFALGWVLITLFARLVTTKLIWWPLIPGGILAVVGWGLYIGGNPNNALSFISNTGSITLILFGIYLILLRRGIR